MLHYTEENVRVRSRYADCCSIQMRQFKPCTDMSFLLKSDSVEKTGSFYQRLEFTHLLSIMPPRCSDTEMSDMVTVYYKYGRQARRASTVYGESYPDRRKPGYRVILRAVQKHG